MIAERENALLKEQELYNRLRNKDYGPAIALALELKRPQKLWGVLRDAMTEGMGEGATGADDEGERRVMPIVYCVQQDARVACYRGVYLSVCSSQRVTRSSAALHPGGCRTALHRRAPL